MAVKKYYELPVEKWNVRCFQEFLIDKHEEILGVSYQPTGGWNREVGLLGTIIGTQKKPAQYDKALIKEFILRCLHDYKPRPGWPGMSFMFMWGQRKNILQQLELEEKQAAKEAAKEEVNYNDVEDWL